MFQLEVPDFCSKRTYQCIILFAWLLNFSCGDCHASNGGKCPNKCCVKQPHPIDCNASPPCSKKNGCPCEPPLPALLSSQDQPKFVNDFVNVLDEEFIFQREHQNGGVDRYTILKQPLLADIGLFDKQGNRLFTPMYGYGTEEQAPTFPGRTFIVKSRKPIQVLWKNELLDQDTGRPLPLFKYLPVDKTIHMAMPMDPGYPKSGIPSVTHLHGGFNHFRSDGYPEAWSTPNFDQVGPFFSNRLYTYDNAQGPTMLWYHDHALGFTRLNNYAGLIGLYIIRGDIENKLIRENEIPSGPYEIPLVIADKMFTADGQLFFPYCSPEEFPCEPQPSVLPEFFGDFILVNGKAWPVLEVEPRAYRLRLLNGADSRFFDLTFQNKGKEAPFTFNQIGTDQGLLNTPVKMDHLLLAPSQRADLVVNFAKHKGETIILKNSANAPFPDGDPVDPASSGLVMAFRVTKPIDKQYPKTKLPLTLRRRPIKPLFPTAPDRQVLLFESADRFCRILPLLGTPQLGALHWDDPVTETPQLGSVEIWEIYNTTEDAHPIHLHSGNFQILNRQFFSADQDPITGALSNIELIGDPIPPTQVENQGFFDTVIVYPKGDDESSVTGQLTRIIMNFTLPGQYVWHCHILSHEDNDMMRPLTIVP